MAHFTFLHCRHVHDFLDFVTLFMTRASKTQCAHVQSQHVLHFCDFV